MSLTSVPAVLCFCRRKLPKLMQHSVANHAGGVRHVFSFFVFLSLSGSLNCQKVFDQRGKKKVKSDCCKYLRHFQPPTVRYVRRSRTFVLFFLLKIAFILYNYSFRKKFINILHLSVIYRYVCLNWTRLVANLSDCTSTAFCYIYRVN